MGLGWPGLPGLSKGKYNSWVPRQGGERAGPNRGWERRRGEGWHGEPGGWHRAPAHYRAAGGKPQGGGGQEGEVVRPRLVESSFSGKPQGEAIERGQSREGGRRVPVGPPSSNAKKEFKRGQRRAGSLGLGR
ncbi:unnamed protein product [Calypogeia fissa]